MNYMRDAQKQLQDLNILVTRPEHQNNNLAELIELAGGKAIKFPVMEIVAPDNLEIASMQLSKSGQWDWLIFTSANAVNFALKICQRQLSVTGTTKVAAIGETTANCLLKYGIKANLVPQTSNSERLASALQMQQISNKRCLIIKGEGGREKLQEILTNLGAIVTSVNVYRRTCPETNPELLLKHWSHEGIDFVTITSVESLENLIRLIGEKGHDLLKQSVVVAFSPRIRDAAFKRGLTQVITAATTSDSSIIESIVQAHQNSLKSTPRVQSTSHL